MTSASPPMPAPQLEGRSGRIALIAFATVAVAGLLVPIYTDEVGWRFQLARSAIDGGVDRGLGEQCGANTIARAPFFMQPMRLLSATAYRTLPDPLVVRTSGIAMALAWAAIVWRLSQRIGAPLRGDVRTLVFSLAGLGVLPFLMVWSRPEQPILLALTASIAVALGGHPASEMRGRTAARIVAIVILGAIALGYHPKAVVFLPIMIAAIAVADMCRATIALRIGGCLMLTMLGVIAYRYWSDRLACPADPALASKFVEESLAFMLQSHAGPADIARQVARSASPYGYIKSVLPNRHYMSSWLPPLPMPFAFRLTWLVLVALGWAATLLALVAILARSGVQAWRERRIDRAPVIACVIVAVSLLWAATQINKNAYESALILPLLLVALLLALPSVPPSLARALPAAAKGALALAIASEAALLAVYAPALARIASRTGYTTESPFSISAYHFARDRAAILAAGRACGIDPALTRPRYLVVDDLTSFAYVDSYRPFHYMAITGLWAGSIGDPIRYLRAYRSSGIVTQCRTLPNALRAEATATGPFCCVAIAR